MIRLNIVAIISFVPFIYLFREAELLKGKTVSNSGQLYRSFNSRLQQTTLQWNSHFNRFFNNYYDRYFQAYKLTCVSMCFRGK